MSLDLKAVKMLVNIGSIRFCLASSAMIAWLRATITRYIVSIILDDLRTNGPIRQALRSYDQLPRRGQKQETIRRAC